MFATTWKIGLVGEALRLVRATLGRLTLVPTADPAPYWTDYLYETRNRRG